MNWLPGFLGALGLMTLISRRTFLGILIGIQLLFLGASMFFVMAGVSAGNRIAGNLIAVFIVLGGVAQWVGGYAVALRLFYLKNEATMDDIRTLRK